MPRVLPPHKPRIPLAKLNPPRLPAIVERPRLYRLLDRARKRPVIWINAPPGFGKTTLVASYLRARKLRSLWYQVDEGDGDLATLFHYLGVAAKQAAPLTRTSLPHLTPEYLQGLPTFTRRFFEELYARLKPPALVIFDNYQEVPPDVQFHDMIALALETAPAGIGVIVMSRAQPPPAFARLQATQHIAFLDEDALRLTKPEARAVVRLHAESNRQTGPALIDTLHDKLQGWVAGLVLELEQVKAIKTEQTAVAHETPQVIFDYLAREVMQRLSPDVQRFLMQTALLPDMTVIMATSLTGATSAGDILTGLYQSRYFTERRIGTEYIYQYHPLFREFLRTRAENILNRDELAKIRRAAASLLEKADRFEDAVDLYAGAGEMPEIIRLILARAPELLQQGRSQTLERWFAHVPAAFYDQEPWLSYWLASCRLATSPLESEAIFERAFDLFKAQGNRAGVLLTLSGIVSSIQFSWIDTSRFDRWIDIMLELVQPDAPFPSKEIEIQFTFSMVTALMWRRPQRSFIAPWINRATHILEDVPEVDKHSFFVAVLGNFLTWLGDLEAADKYSRILKSAAESEACPPLMRLVYCASRASVDWSRGDPEESLRLVEQGLAISTKTGVHVFDVALLGDGTYASLFRNDVPSAERYLKQSAPLVTHPAHVMRANHLYLEAMVARVKGDLIKAWKFIQEALAVKGLKGSLFPEAVVTYAAAEVLHGLGDAQQAKRYIDQVKFVGDEMGSFNLQFIVLMLESQFAFDERREEAGLAALGQALAIGRERNFSFSHFWLSKSMARLCAKALEANIEVEYVQKLICKTKLMPVGQASTNAAWPWPVKIRTLGRFEIHVDGQPLPPRRKAPFRILTLLKAIIAFGGQEVSMSRLIDALWPDTEGDAGQETFHKTLQRLRRLLSHDNVIHVRDGKVSLNRQLCWIDAMAFQTLLSGSDDSKPRQPQTDAGGRRYEQAIALYRGPFLAGDDSYAWVDHSRERLRHQFVQAVQQVSEWKKAEGQEGAAVACLEKGLEADPLAEPIYPRLITFFQASGRQDDAKTVWAQYRQAVVAAGREPSIEMQRLAKQFSTS